jgi:hypothetical protein
MGQDADMFVAGVRDSNIRRSWARGWVGVVVFVLVTFLIAPRPARSAPQVAIDYRGMIVHGVVHDFSGHGNEGKVLGYVSNADGPGVITFPRCVSCGRSAVEPENVAALNVGAGNFSFSTKFRIVIPPEGDAGLNVIQHGLYASRGGQWKFQLDGLKPQCRFTDASGVTEAVPPNTSQLKTLRLQNWYAATCRRAGDVFSLTMTGADGTHLQLSATRHLGAILPIGPVSIGSKPLNGPQTDERLDQFHGDLRDIVVTKG